MDITNLYQRKEMSYVRISLRFRGYLSPSPFLPSSLPLRYIVYQFDDKVENVTIQHVPVPVTQLKL